MKSEARCWLDLGKRLGIEVVAPFELSLAGVQVHFTALLPQFGAPRGMVVDSDSETIWQHRKELSAAGYGFSCVGCDDSQDNLDPAREMLSDWGWSSDLPKPDWLRL
jgi:hypothetical protein